MVYFRDETVIKAAVAALGDLADALGPKLKMLFQEHSIWIDELLREFLQSDDEQLKEAGLWTQGMIGRAL